MLKRYNIEQALTNASAGYFGERADGLNASRELASQMREDFAKFVSFSPEMSAIMAKSPVNEVLEAAGTSVVHAAHYTPTRGQGRKLPPPSKTL